VPSSFQRAKDVKIVVLAQCHWSALCVFITVILTHVTSERSDTEVEITTVFQNETLICPQSSNRNGKP